MEANKFEEGGISILKKIYITLQCMYTFLYYSLLHVLKFVNTVLLEFCIPFAARYS